MLKDLQPGTPVELKALDSEEHHTKPPARYTEPSLVKTLSDLGIGRPSTFSSIVSLIQDRGYVQKRGSQLYPTPLGFAVARILSEKFPTFTSYDYSSTMEQELDSISEGHLTKEGFLKDFWQGDQGFEAHIKELLTSVDYKELEQYLTVDLHNGYSIKINRFGVFLQDDKGTPDSKGYLPSLRLEETVDPYTLLEPETCKELFEAQANKLGPRELGVLEGGTYQGWTLWLKEGKYGTFLQAVAPGEKKGGPKPVNMKLPEGVDPETFTLEQGAPLFQETKLPRTLSDNFFVGIGKRGPWLGHKTSAKARRAVFVSLPEGTDPRTISLEEAEAVWQEKQAKKKKS